MMASDEEGEIDEFPFEPNRCPALAVAMDLPELPAAVFIEAVELARSIPFDRDSAFAQARVGVRGYCETHPALQCLSAWWAANAPARAVLMPGSCRVWVDGRFGYDSACGDVPTVPFTVMARDIVCHPAAYARLTREVLVSFMAAHRYWRFDPHGGLDVRRVDGWLEESVGVPQAEVDAGRCDIALPSLVALQEFPDRYADVWRELMCATTQNPATRAS